MGAECVAQRWRGGRISAIFDGLMRRRRHAGSGPADIDDVSCEYHRMGDDHLPVHRPRAHAWQSRKSLGPSCSQEDRYHELVDAEVAATETDITSEELLCMVSMLGGLSGCPG